jgi:hypothetical protein
MWILFIIMWIFIYFLPTFIAIDKKSKNKNAVIVINLFLGWTLLGWVVALAMSVSNIEK